MALKGSGALDIRPRTASVYVDTRNARLLVLCWNPAAGASSRPAVNLKGQHTCLPVGVFLAPCCPCPAFSNAGHVCCAGASPAAWAVITPLVPLHAQLLAATRGGLA